MKVVWERNVSSVHGWSLVVIGKHKVSRVISSACVFLFFSFPSSRQVSLLFAPPPALTWRSAQNVAATLLALIGPHSHTASQEGKWLTSSPSCPASTSPLLSFSSFLSPLNTYAMAGFAVLDCKWYRIWSDFPASNWWKVVNGCFVHFCLCVWVCVSVWRGVMSVCAHHVCLEHRAGESFICFSWQTLHFWHFYIFFIATAA